jgi:DNA-binding transcriptional LysR family regulator
MEDLNSIAIFTRVAERKSFTLAARDLRMSPSAVSKHISELEQRLGVTLLIRSTRKFSLTEAGEAFLDRCSRAMAELSDAVASVSDLYRTPRGTLRLSAAWGFAEAVLTPIIHEFIEQHPELRVELTMNVLPVNLVEAGMDVVIRSGGMVDSSLSFRELGPVRYVICGSPDFFARHGKPERPKDLEHYNCLNHAIYSAKEWWFTENGRDIAVRVHGNYEANSSEALREAAVNGLGLARLPDYVADKDVRAGRLETVFAGRTTSKQVMRAFFHQGRAIPAKTTVFLDFLERRIKTRRYLESAV